MKKTSMTLFLLSLSGLAFAHTINKPVDEIPSTGNTRPSNHSGYGYLNTSSESEAADKVNFVCPEDNKIQEISGSCNPFQGELYPANKKIEGMYNAMNGAVFTQELRNNIYDYLVLQKAALSDARPVDIKKPSCISSKDDSRKIPVDSKSEVAWNQDIKQLQQKVINTNNVAKKKELDKKLKTMVKIHAIKANQSPRKLSQALVLDDQYRNAWNTSDCANSTIARVQQMCASIKEFQQKLRSSYPLIFNNNELMSKATEKKVTFRSSFSDTNNKLSEKDIMNLSDTPKQVQLKESIKIMVGAHNAPEGLTKEEILQRGDRLYKASVESQYGIGFDKNSIDTLYNTAHDSGVIGEYDPTLGNYTINPNMKNRVQSQDSIVSKIKNTYAKSLKSEVNFLCGDNTTNQLKTKNLAKLYPQVLKQMLLDTNEEAFKQAKYYICKNKLDTLMSSPTANSCVGVTGDLDSSNGMQVDRYEYSFPFGGSKSYNIKKVGKELVVKTKINFKFIYDPSFNMTEEEQKERFNVKIQKWKTKTNTYFSSLKAKMTPPVTLSYEVGTGTEEPVVNVSECYNRELPKADQHRCDKVNEEGGNRQDAGNYTIDTDDKALAHEMGHQLGLDDEYEASYYPINNLGEDDSIMNLGLNLYPRHVRRIIQPALRCGGTTRPELTPVYKK